MLKLLGNPNINIYNSVYKYLDSNMYAIVDSGSCVIIDPHESNELLRIFIEKKVKDIVILLTHEHQDHTSGIYYYQEKFKSRLICQEDCAKCMQEKKYLRPTMLSFAISERDKINNTRLLDEFKLDFFPRNNFADEVFSELYCLKWHNHIFHFYHIPGHSKGSTLIVMDHKIAFSGDSLLEKYPIIVRFPESSKEDYLSKTLPLFNRVITENMVILPGHGKPFNISKIKKEGTINVQFQ